MFDLSFDAITFKFTVSFGDSYPAHKKQKYIDEIARFISKETGGLNVQRGAGYWRDDGNSPDPPYTGECHREDSVTFVVRADIGSETEDPNHKTEEFVASIRSIIKHVTQLYTAPVNWVDVEYNPVFTSHFSVN